MFLDKVEESDYHFKYVKEGNGISEIQTHT